jgi:hypothetical protein
MGLGSFEDSVSVGYHGTVNGRSECVLDRASGASGVPLVHNFTYQSEFNVDKLDGTGASGFILDHTKMNTFQFSLQWLGTGAITFFVENPATGKLITFHQMQLGNTLTEPTLADPNGLKIFAFAAHNDFSATPGPGVTMRTSAIAAFLEGPEPLYGPLRGTENEVAATTGSPVIGLRNAVNFPVGSANLNNTSMLIREIIVAKTSGNRAGIFRLHLNPTTTTGASWVPYGTNVSVGEVDTSATVVSGGEIIDVTPTSAIGIDTEKFTDLRLPPGETLYIVFNTSGSASDILAAINWIDLF